MKLYHLLWFTTLVYEAAASTSKIETVYEWKYFNITPIPSKYGESSYRGNIYYFKRNCGDEVAYFNRTAAVPIDVDKSKDGRVFVAIVGKPDVKVTLTTVTNTLAESGPVLAPYPDYSWHKSYTDCSKFISIYNVAIDKCNRLWVLDTGRINSCQKCDAKLVVFDLNTDTHLNTYSMDRIISEKDNGRGVLVSPVINTHGESCETTTVYIGDSEGYALVIFNGTEFRRLNGRAYGPDRKEMNFTIDGLSFILPGGIDSMVLDPTSERLFFAPLASRDLSVLKVSDLANVFNGGQQPVPIVAKHVFTSQPTSLQWTSSNGGVLFAGLAGCSIVCWKGADKLCTDDIDTTVTDTVRLQYIRGLKVIPPSDKTPKEELWFLTNRLQKSIKKERNFEEINFRILKGIVENLIEGTKCKNAASETCSGTEIAL